MSQTFDLFDELPFSEEGKNTEPKNSQPKKKEGVKCPICSKELRTADERQINEHVDECLAKQFAEEKATNTPVKSNPKSSITPSQTNPPSKCPACGVYGGHLTYCAHFVKTNNSTTSSANPPLSSTSYNPHFPDFKKKSSDSFNPFAVLCPYPSCGLKMEAREFVKHASSVHSHAPQVFACPVCVLLGYSGYTVKQDTNLLSHLQTTHADLFVEDQLYDNDLYGSVSEIPNSEPDFIYDPADFIVDEEPLITKVDLKNLSKTVGSTYVEEIVKESKPGFECSICYEEFQTGLKVARMDCFCVFHTQCIEKWFKKQSKCPLHKE